MGTKNVYTILVENVKEKATALDLVVDGTIIL
jgi:hypothetical protein